MLLWVLCSGPHRRGQPGCSPKLQPSQGGTGMGPPTSQSLCRGRTVLKLGDRTEFQRVLTVGYPSVEVLKVEVTASCVLISEETLQHPVISIDKNWCSMFIRLKGSTHTRGRDHRGPAQGMSSISGSMQMSCPRNKLYSKMIYNSSCQIVEQN